MWQSRKVVGRKRLDYPAKRLSYQSKRKHYLKGKVVCKGQRKVNLRTGWVHCKCQELCSVKGEIIRWRKEKNAGVHPKYRQQQQYLLQIILNPQTKNIRTLLPAPNHANLIQRQEQSPQRQGNPHSEKLEIP